MKVSKVVQGMTPSLSLKPLRLPTLRFALPEDFALAGIEEVRARAHQLRDRYAGDFGHPKQLDGDIEAIGRAVQQRRNPQAYIMRPRDVRLLFLAYLKFYDLLKLRPFTEAFAQACRNAATPRLSRLTLALMARLFFEHFDDVTKQPLLIAFFYEKLEEAKIQGRLLHHLEPLYSHRKTVVSVTGPKALATQARQQDQPLEAVLQQAGVPDSAVNEFSDTCRQIYYLDTLRALSPGDTHTVFDELLREAVLNKTYDANALLGHEVIKIMVDAGEQSGGMPENWLRILLRIAGDPRISKASNEYQKWWGRLSLRYANAVRQWLSGFDIRLFLSALLDHARRSGNKALERMFPARERFLLGLLEHEKQGVPLVRHTRLFLGRAAEEYLHREYKPEEIPLYERLSDGEKSVIYLQIGDVHLLEGTHNFKFRLFDKLPTQCVLTQTDHIANRRVNIDELTRIARRYQREFGDVMAGDQLLPIEVAHTPALTWQYKLIRGFEIVGIRLRPDWVLHPNDLSVYKRKFGL